MKRTTVLLALLASALTLVLFQVSYGVQHMEGELGKINNDILTHRQAIHVLKAEWSHLNEPDRLRKLSKKHLDLGPLSASQIGAIGDFPLAASAIPEDMVPRAIQPVSVPLARKEAR
jgi:hypothetical protein